MVDNALKYIGILPHVLGMWHTRLEHMARTRRTPKFQFDNAEDRLPGKTKATLGESHARFMSYVTAAITIMFLD